MEGDLSFWSRDLWEDAHERPDELEEADWDISGGGIVRMEGRGDLQPIFVDVDG